MQVESMDDIRRRWRREGVTYRTADLVAEHQRQCREALREHEDALLAAADEPGATEHTRALAEQIRDHRAAGNYTTQGPRVSVGRGETDHLEMSLSEIYRFNDHTCEGCGARPAGNGGEYQGSYWTVTGDGASRTLCEACALPYDERDDWTVTMIPTYAQARAAQRWADQGIGAD